MPEPMSQDERRRWARVARLTHELGATREVQTAIANRPVPLPALHAAEACLDELDAPLPGEPIETAATGAISRALSTVPTEAP